MQKGVLETPLSHFKYAHRSDGVHALCGAALHPAVGIHLGQNLVVALSVESDQLTLRSNSLSMRLLRYNEPLNCHH